MHSYHLNVFELEVSFKTEADPTRVENACAYVENLYRDLKLHGNHLGRDRLLTILILGIADDLLQLKQQAAIPKINIVSSLSLPRWFPWSFRSLYRFST